MEESTSRSDFQRAGYHTVTPRIVASEARELVAFLELVFDASARYANEAPVEVTIGDSLILVTDAGARAPHGAFLYVYVSDPDAAFGRAVAAGARVIELPADMPYGDRRGMIEDKWGNTWQIASRIKEQD